MSESKKELIAEHRRLTGILKDGTKKDRLEEYERQLKELKGLLSGKEYEPANESVEKDDSPKPMTLVGTFQTGDMKFRRAFQRKGPGWVHAGNNTAEPKPLKSILNDVMDSPEVKLVSHELKKSFDDTPPHDDALEALITRIEASKANALDKAITITPREKPFKVHIYHKSGIKIKTLDAENETQARMFADDIGRIGYNTKVMAADAPQPSPIVKPRPSMTVAKSSYGPKGADLYDETNNAKRKANRTGDVVEDAGQNKAVHQYTSATMGTASQQASAQAAKDLAANRKQKVKTLKDLSPEERKKMEDLYRAEALTKANARLTLLRQQLAKAIAADKAARPWRQPSDSEMFGHLLSDPNETDTWGQVQVKLNPTDEEVAAAKASDDDGM